jgi:hypothetical protein
VGLACSILYVLVISLKSLKLSNDKKVAHVFCPSQPEEPSVLPHLKGLVSHDLILKQNSLIADKFEKGDKNVMYKEINNICTKKASSILSQHSKKRI